MIAISLIMPCYNRSYDLLQTLKAYEQQTAQSAFELIAIDDASTDSTWELLSTYTPQNYLLHIIRQPQNQGPASARNRGIEVAQAPLIAFVGDDILPATNFVQQHLKAHQIEPDSKIAFLGKVSWPDNLPQNTLMKHIDGVGAQQFSYHYLKDRQEYDYRHFYTANISLKRCILDSVDHWFDTSFPYAAYEDAELSYRLGQQGMRIRYAKNIEGTHYHYHTIWSFAIRQYHCGLMSRILIYKHPRLVKDMLGSAHRRLLRITKRLLIGLNEDEMAQLEKKIMTLASYFEWKPNPILDTFYSALLEYFYCKGVYSGFFTNTTFLRPILAAHARVYLVSLIKSVIQNAQFHKISLPSGFAKNLC